MRDRLTEIVKKSLVKNIDHTHRLAENITDDLLAAGVIVPPCNVGQTVYFSDHEKKSVWEGHIGSFSLDAAHLWFNCHYKCGLNIWHPIEDFGKIVFLTKEEAEKALAERSGSDG